MMTIKKFSEKHILDKPSTNVKIEGNSLKTIRFHFKSIKGLTTLNAMNIDSAITYTKS